MQQVQALGKPLVLFLTDCLQLQQAQSKRENNFSYFEEIVRDCKALGQQFSYVDVNHIKRDFNTLGDTVAKVASSHGETLWSSYVSNFLESFFSNNVIIETIDVPSFLV